MRNFTKISLLGLFILIAFFKETKGQDTTFGTYNNQSVITTYNGGTIKLTNGFNTAGHDVHIYVTEGAAPVANTPTALSTSQNYIATWTPTAPITDPNTITSKPLQDVKLSVQYFDGLGRPIQTVLKQGSLETTTGTSADLVSATLYDDFGRANIELLPYPAVNGTSDGHFRTTVEGEQSGWYGTNPSSPVAGQGEHGSNARSLTIFENSPLNRVVESFAPGDSWHGSSDALSPTDRHSIKQKFWTNTAADGVRIWNVSFVSTPGSGFGTYSSPGAYPAGRLYKNVTEDEENRQVIEFKDFDGNVILKKVQLSSTGDNGAGSGHVGWLCTYYLYDDLGNLRCVVQPEGVKALEANGWSFTADILKEQCFKYEYDGRNRMVIKQVPGAGPVFMVYDNRDRLVMTQDSMMRSTGQWLATHYDNLNRADTTWLYTSTASFTSILSAAAGSSVYPTTAPTEATILTETHYDDYDKLPASLPTGMTTTYKTDWDAEFAATSTTSFPYPEKPTQNTDITTKGLVTWTRVKVLDSTLHLSSINIYDNKGRLIQTQSENITGGIDVTTTQYSWAGWPLVTVQKQQFKKGTTSEITVVVTKMTYDDLGRLVKTEMKESNSLLNNGAMSAFATISELAYDALGQVTEKKLGKRRTSATAYTTTPLETQKYDYNIRGWLLGVNRDYVNDESSTNTTATVGVEGVISGEMFTESSMDIQSVLFPNSNFFGFELAYDKKTDPNRIYNIPYDSARYDGNITGMTWKGANDMKVRKYDFGYDPVSRLTKANFGQSTGTAFSKATVNYDVTNLNYDANGNILTMNQYGLKPSGCSAIIDQLSYSYKANSNKLTKVTDLAPSTVTDQLGDFQDGVNAGDDYAYDGNGNLISDQNKKISLIRYNILNLPSEIQVAGKGSIKYYYDATGNKLQKRTLDNTLSTTSPTVTNYIGGAVYLNDTLQFFGTPEGRVRIDTVIKGWVYDYYLSDHLGNTRLMLTDDYNVASPVLEAYSYYPFGLQQKGISLIKLGISHNKHLYNKGSELQEDLVVDYYDTHFRNLDPQLGRWWQIDPKPAYAQSLYSSMNNNPIKFNDPLGDTIIIQFKTGFLGLGKTQEVIYNNGSLSNKNGSAYGGKVKGYLGKVVGALGSLNKTTEGESMVSELQGSKNNYKIMNGSANSFTPSKLSTSYANVQSLQNVSNGSLPTGGSGGTIVWNPSISTSGMNTAGNIVRPPYIGLGHEMAHGRDVNQGVLYIGGDYINPLNGNSYSAQYEGLKKSEWRAVYYENIIRSQAGIPLRTQYGLQSDGGSFTGTGPSLLSPTGQPINYPIQ